MKRKLFSVLLVLATMLALTFSFGLNRTPTVKAATWTQVWSDEFAGTANTGVNTSNWLYDTGTSYPGGAANWGTSEVETMTSSTSNVYLDGSGRLAIKPIRSSSGAWTSGRIETQRTDFAPPSGGEMAVEASIQMPNVTGTAAYGYWPAFWMLGAPFRGVYTNWPSIGEIDVMENVQGQNTEYGTFHCGVASGGPCNETTGLGGTTSCTPTTCQAAFHTYRMELDKSVTPNQIRWYLDGVNFFTLNSSQVDATTWSNATNHGFFIILNVAMGGAFPAAFGGGPTSSTTSGIPMLVDYVRVYTASGTSTSTPTPTPTSTSCTSGSFTYGVVSASSTTALPWFKPCDWTAGYVILHYITPNISQQNVNMTYNSSTARWEYTVSNINAGQVLQYQFTYQKSGLQYDTAWYTWTHP